MAFYIVTGRLGSGKSLLAVSKIRDHLMAGLRVATNLDINPEYLLPPDVRKIDLIRLPDLPNVFDLEALGKGSKHYADESKFGLLVIDEASGSFNAREWADKGRQAVIDWFKHARKNRWHVYILIQSASMLDKQIREAFGEHLVVCKRLDRLNVPVVGGLFSLLGARISPPKIHVGIVRYGLSHTDPVVDKWFYRGTSIYKGFDTEQVFDRATSPAMFSYLSPYYLRGYAMDKFKLARAMCAGYLSSAFIAGLLLSFLFFYYYYRDFSVLKAVSSPAAVGATAATPFDSLISVTGVFFDGDLAIAYLSDGRVIRTTDFVRDEKGIGVKVGSVYVYKRG